MTGGPGTGKTYTAGHLIKIFWNSLTIEQRQKCEIVLAAPTGKAAARLQQSLIAATSELKEFTPLSAKTLHSLLNLKQGSFKRSEIHPLSADLVLIDESSMIDIQMMSALFASIKPGGRLILLGDPFQLPSVEAGSLFADLIDLHQKSSFYSKRLTQLSQCLRSELNSLVDLAKAIKEGAADKALSLLSFHQSSELSHINIRIDDTKKEEIQKKFFEEYEKYFFIHEKEEQNLLKIFEFFNQFRLLSPLKQGPFGSEELNRFFLENFMRKIPLGQKLIAPIMINRNDYQMDLFNGEVGVLIRSLPKPDDLSFSQDDVALFAAKDGTIIRKIPSLLLPSYEYAYCLTVHKSQGSEFDHVSLVLPKGSEFFGREILYTAITRAKKQLDIWGSEEIIREAISRPSTRQSGVFERMKKLMQIES